jgi:hypothetical protein
VPLLPRRTVLLPFLSQEFTSQLDNAVKQLTKEAIGWDLERLESEATESHLRAQVEGDGEQESSSEEESSEEESSSEYESSSEEDESSDDEASPKPEKKCAVAEADTDADADAASTPSAQWAAESDILNKLIGPKS